MPEEVTQTTTTESQTAVETTVSAPITTSAGNDISFDPGSDLNLLHEATKVIDRGKGAEVKAEDKKEEPKKEAAEEKKTEEKVETKPAEERLDRSWAAIKKAESEARKMRDEARKLKAEIDARSKENFDLRAEIQKDPFEALKKIGTSFDDVVKYALANPEKRETNTQVPSQVQEYMQKVEALEQKVKKSEDEKILLAYRTALTSSLQDDNFSLLRSRDDAVDQMISFSMAYAEEHPGEPLLPPEQIAGILQDTYREELTSLASTPATRAELKKLLAEIVDEDKSVEEKATSHAAQEKQGKKKPTTLSNNLAATGPAPVNKDERLSEAELLKQAAALIPPDAWDRLP